VEHHTHNVGVLGTMIQSVVQMDEHMEIHVKLFASEYMFIFMKYYKGIICKLVILDCNSGEVLKYISTWKD